MANYLTPFVGRQADQNRIIDLFRDPSVRLVTILGEGGIGKTRLALELAGKLEERFQHKVLFIPLAQLNTGNELLPALAEKLGVQLPPGSDLKQAVLEHLANLQVLLFLDNFEHLLEEAVLVREILAAGSLVQVLVTSREKLGLETETLYHLKGLELPQLEELQEIEQYDAVRLFLQKARQARPGFSLNAGNAQTVVRICQLVDGNPLGILLAAAWAEYFSPAEIVAQINVSLDFLSQNIRDAVPRHSSIRAVFASSFSCLDDHQKAVFRKLAFFRGGFDLAAAQTVARADLRTLIGLVDKSLLARNPDSSRYELHELLRQYALEELLAAGEQERVQTDHTNYYLGFVCRQYAKLISPEQTAALDEIQMDFDNIRQAWGRAIQMRDFPAAGAALPCLYDFCDARSRFYEGEAIFHLAKDGLAPQAGEAPQPAWALALLSWYDLRAYNEQFKSFEDMASLAQSCLEHALSVHDPQGTAASLVLLGAIAEDQQDFEAAIQKYEEAMQAYPSLDDVYWVNMRIGLCRLSAQQYPEAIQAFETSLQSGKKTGERVKIGWSLVNIGDALLLQANPVEARKYLEQACVLFQEVGTRFGVLWSNYSLSQVAIELGNLGQAREHAESASQIARQIHSVSWIEKTDALLRQSVPEHSTESAWAKNGKSASLSPRELEMLQLLKSEMNGPEIASSLVISLNTVRYHTKNIYQKLGVNTRLEAIRRAKELGL
jgi:predicted ATPase/DNA-binding CsgD family transcriptional regulator